RPFGDFALSAGDSIAFHARFSGERIALVELASGRRLTYAEFDNRIAKCAGFLASALGDHYGKRVALLSRNSAAFLALHFACARVGAIFQPLNWRLAGPELRVLIADAAPELFIYQDEFAAAADIAMTGAPLKRVMKIGAGRDELRDAIDAAS